jgi:cell fate (sporulation/competence/biofilm development) regulator YlbF (YheA/YmcA/DUF963 family)
MSAEFSHMRMRSTTPSQQDRISQIRAEVAELTKNKSPELSFTEIQELLSLRSGRTFNADLLKDVFLSVSKDISANISNEEFISGFYSAETALKSRIDVLKKEIQDCSIQLTNTRRQFIEAKANKIPEDNNVLTIIVKKAEVKTSKSIAARVICDDWEVSTNPTSNSVWDEPFTFNPQSHRPVIIELWECDKSKLTTCIGNAEIVLEPLRDEEMHENWLTVKGSVRSSVGSVLIVAQWIKNKADYLERLISGFDKEVGTKRKEISSLEAKYEEFLHPFSVNSPQWFLYSPRFKKAEQELSQQIDEFATKTFGKKLLWPKAMQITVYLYVLLSVCNMLFRPDFVNVMNKLGVTLYSSILLAHTLSSICCKLQSLNNFGASIPIL